MSWQMLFILDFLPVRGRNRCCDSRVGVRAHLTSAISLDYWADYPLVCNITLASLSTLLVAQHHRRHHMCMLPCLLIWQPNSVSTSIWAAAAASRHAEAESQPKITEAVAAVEMLFDIHLPIPLPPPTTRSRNLNAKEMEIDGYPSSSSSTRVMGR